MTDVLDQQNRLQNEARNLVDSTSLLSFLKRLGQPIQVGSSVTGLMTHPDIDFTIQNDTLDINDAIALTSVLFEELKISALKIADFRKDKDGDAGYYIGFELPFNNKTWHIDATVGKVGPIVTNPPELATWLEAMNNEDRITILTLKKQLIDEKRYVGVRSQPPYTFRSVHLYEAVLKGGAKTVTDVENYFR